MSQWTHFIGTIQCSRAYDDVVAALGKPVLWHDSDNIEYGTPEYEEYHHNVWCAAFKNFENGCGIPMGSEGSINWKYYNTSTEDECVIGEGSLIAIEGDLRDFGDDPADIQRSIDWFVRGCKALDARAAVLRIEVEFGETFLIEYDWDETVTTKLREFHFKGENDE